MFGCVGGVDATLFFFRSPACVLVVPMHSLLFCVLCGRGSIGLNGGYLVPSDLRGVYFD